MLNFFNFQQNMNVLHGKKKDLRIKKTKKNEKKIHSAERSNNDRLQMQENENTEIKHEQKG